MQEINPALTKRVDADSRLLVKYLALTLPIPFIAQLPLMGKQVWKDTKISEQNDLLCQSSNKLGAEIKTFLNSSYAEKYIEKNRKSENIRRKEGVFRIPFQSKKDKKVVIIVKTSDPRTSPVSSASR